MPRMKTQLKSLGKMTLLIEQPDDDFAVFHPHEEWSSRFAMLPTEVAEILHRLLLDGFDGSVAEAIACAERLAVMPRGTEA